MSTQPTSYTLPSIPQHVEQELKRRAAVENKHIEAVIVETLERGLGLKGQKQTDLDFLVGTWQEDPEFDEAVKAFEQIDEGLWR